MPLSRLELKSGDRVCIQVAVPGRGYQCGDKGTITAITEDMESAVRLYHVAMDKAGLTGTTIIFTEEEIEPDG